MLNTYTTYSLLTKDLAKALNRVEKQPVVERDTKYYLENIGKVTSVKEFVDDYRLFSYAMKAHGLSDMTYAKAFMVKVLEGGVSDPDSFANRLSDKRYLEFAKTFDFARNGAQATTFNSAQHDVPKTFLAQMQLTTSQAGFGFVEEETSYFLENIGSVTSIDDLIANERLLRYAMTAYDLSIAEEPTARVREMLEGGVTDPNSPANMLGDKRYAKFVAAFDFVTHGANTTSRDAVTGKTPATYLQASGLQLFKGVSDATRAEIDYFTANIGNVKTIGNLIGDKRLLTFAMASYGLDAKTEPTERVRAMLLGGVSDPGSPANQLTDKRYAAFVTAFNFAEYGSATTARDQAVDGTVKLYYESGNPENAYFRANIGSVASVGDLLRDERLLTYAMAAYGLNSKTEPRTLVREMLLGGVTDPGSPANQSTDTRYKAFVAAFDFVQYGAAATSRPEVQSATPRLNIENQDPETAYFRANIGKVKSINGLLSDNRLLTYAMAAYGIDATFEDPAFLRTMLAGGVASPTSPANLLGDDSYVRFVAAFDFSLHGANTTSRAEVLEGTATSYTTMSQFGLVKPSSTYLNAETEYYRANVTKLRSVDDLMADKRLLNYALLAYRIDPATAEPAYIRRMLEGGTANPDSAVNKSGDSRYLAFVSTFNFFDKGENVTSSSRALRPAVDKYMRQTLEENAGQENEGVRLALYFERKAPTITSFYEVLADPALAEVVRTMLSLPDSFAQADVDKQVQYFESRLKIDDFSDPEALGKLMTRFTSLWEINNPTSTPATAASILFSQPVEYGISSDLLFTMQRMRF